MKRKCLAVSIILLFIGTTIIPSTAQNIEKSSSASRGHWLYVGGSGPGNYSTIQDAVNASTDGDTVFVYDDSSPYYEHVVVGKSMNFIGENKDTTVIDGSGNGTILLLAEKAIGVTVSGFTIQNSGSNESEIRAGIRVFAQCNIITNNIIRNNDVGIYIYSDDPLNCGGNIISFNTILNNHYSVVLIESYLNRIFWNYIANNEDGICLLGPQVMDKERTLLSGNERQNDIYNNTIIDNKDIGIAADNYYYQNIFQNNISNNSYGIYMEAGYLGGCGYFNIYQNIINRNKHGIFMDVPWEYGGIGSNNIFDNNITFNGEGIGMSATAITHISHNTIYQNNFIGNTKHANDIGRNNWFNDTIKRGNYWDDYTGQDILPPYGIGDTPYGISPHPLINKDKYPLMKPYNGTQSSLNSQIQNQTDNTANSFSSLFLILSTFIGKITYDSMVKECKRRTSSRNI